MGPWLEGHRTSPLLREIGGEIQEWADDVASVRPAPARLTVRNRLASAWRKHFEARTPDESGERHRWMYDEVSLGELLQRAGFREVRRVTHDRSRIPQWISFGFDGYPDGRPRQPGSLWMEAIK